MKKLIILLAVLLTGCTANLSKGYRMCDSADKCYDSVKKYQKLSWQELQNHEPLASEICDAQEDVWLDKMQAYADSMKFYYDHKYELKLAIKKDTFKVDTFIITGQKNQ
jgi:hypothetical protein